MSQRPPDESGSAILAGSPRSSSPRCGSGSATTGCGRSSSSSSSPRSRRAASGMTDQTAAAIYGLYTARRLPVRAAGRLDRRPDPRSAQGRVRGRLHHRRGALQHGGARRCRPSISVSCLIVVRHGAAQAQRQRDRRRPVSGRGSPPRRRLLGLLHGNQHRGPPRAPGLRLPRREGRLALGIRRGGSRHGSRPHPVPARAASTWAPPACGSKADADPAVQQRARGGSLRWGSPSRSAWVSCLRRSELTGLSRMTLVGFANGDGILHRRPRDPLLRLGPSLRRADVAEKKRVVVIFVFFWPRPSSGLASSRPDPPSISSPSRLTDRMIGWAGRCPPPSSSR